jgi:hypothetical protein
MGRQTNFQIRINRLINLTHSELKKTGLLDVPTPVLLNNAVTLALKTKGNSDVIDELITELERRRDTIDDVPSSSYLSALVQLLTKGDDGRDEKDKSLQELMGEGEIGKPKRV